MVKTDRVEYCRACGEGLADEACFSFGDASICNRFMAPSDASSAVAGHYPLVLGECRRCRLIQLVEVPETDAIRPGVPWISYTEPEKHLDALVTGLNDLIPLGGITTIGVGPFEEPLLARLAARGARVHHLDLLAEAGQKLEGFPYLETMQEILASDSIVADAGRGELVSCRYLLEHCGDPVKALRNLAAMLAPSGLLLIEIPDSTGFLASKDYSFLWEEHSCYFTEQSFRNLAALAGFEVVSLFRFPGQFEDALVFMLKPGMGLSIALETELGDALFGDFCRQFDKSRNDYAAALAQLHDEGRKLAIFGVGHQAIMFANLFGLADHLSMAVDDHPGKRGRWLPGTRVEIVSTEAFLADPNISVCLLAVNPEIAKKIMQKCESFIRAGGVFLSIYPSGPIPTLIDKTLQWN